jgi:plasmid stabilization system protein ParE
VTSKPRVAYRVSINARAERDLASLYDEIDADSSGAGRNWYAGLSAAIFDLEKQPHIWPKTPESPRFRHLLFGRKPHRVYRVIYLVRERQKVVEILHVRHGSRRPFHPSEMK